MRDKREYFNKTDYAKLFASDQMADGLTEEVAKVSFRRFVISSPRDNLTEAFRFSSRHSEFVKLQAEALVATSEVLSSTAAAGSTGAAHDFRRQYKVVLEYPD